MRETLSTWRRLRADQNGVVSFEYVIVTAVMVATTAAAFSTDAADAIRTVLTNAIGAITAAIMTIAGGG